MPFIRLYYEKNKQFVYYLHNQTKFFDSNKNLILFRNINNLKVNNSSKKISYKVVDYITIISFHEFYIINEDNIRNKAQKKGINLDNFYNELKLSSLNYDIKMIDELIKNNKNKKLSLNLENGNKKVIFNINNNNKKNKKKVSLNLENGNKKVTFNINNNKKNKKPTLNLENTNKKVTFNTKDNNISLKKENTESNELNDLVNLVLKNNDESSIRKILSDIYDNLGKKEKEKENVKNKKSKGVDDDINQLVNSILRNKENSDAAKNYLLKEIYDNLEKRNNLDNSNNYMGTLLKYLEKNKIVDNSAGGDCLFKSFQTHLNIDHTELRKQSVDWVCRHWYNSHVLNTNSILNSRTLEQFKSKEEYRNFMSVSGNWGDQVSILALSIIHNLTVKVIYINDNGSVDSYEPFNPGHQEIYLFFSKEFHYQAIV